MNMSYFMWYGDREILTALELAMGGVGMAFGRESVNGPYRNVRGMLLPRH
jgi:hypothetical protein